MFTKYLCAAIMCLVSIQNLHAQSNLLSLDTNSNISLQTTTNNQQYNYTTIPTIYQKPITTALQYYPELQHVTIIFRIKKQKAPLSARPTIGSTFLHASRRTYYVTISNKTLHKLQAIQFDSLSPDAQVGVIGHELAHIADFNSRKGVYFIRLLFGHLSKKYMDEFEYNTDKRCIQHGLGKQLLAWSKEVRQKLHIQYWKGIKGNTAPAERYMNPDTIEREMGLR
jgi:hypothetical protein